MRLYFNSTGPKLDHTYEAGKQESAEAIQSRPSDQVKVLAWANAPAVSRNHAVHELPKNI